MEFLRKLRASFGGYFWLPCPICGEEFGGFECAEGVSLITEIHPWGTKGSLICRDPACAIEAKRRNQVAVAPVVGLS